jgi:hypothetical protein
LEDAGEFDRQREVAAELDAYAGATCRRQRLEHVAGENRWILELPDDPDLHVADEKREPARVARLPETLWDLEPDRFLHLNSSGRSFRADSGRSRQRRHVACDHADFAPRPGECHIVGVSLEPGRHGLMPRRAPVR